MLRADLFFPRKLRVDLFFSSQTEARAITETDHYVENEFRESDMNSSETAMAAHLMLRQHVTSAAHSSGETPVPA